MIYDGPARDTCREMLPILQHGAREAADPIRYWAGVVLYITGCMGGDIGFANASTLLGEAAKQAAITGDIVDALTIDADDCQGDDDDEARTH